MRSVMLGVFCLVVAAGKAETCTYDGGWDHAPTWVLKNDCNLNLTRNAKVRDIHIIGTKARIYLNGYKLRIMSDRHEISPNASQIVLGGTAEARFTSPTEKCYTTNQEQESPCQPMLRSECCDEKLLAGSSRDRLDGRHGRLDQGPSARVVGAGEMNYGRSILKV